MGTSSARRLRNEIMEALCYSRSSIFGKHSAPAHPQQSVFDNIETESDRAVTVHRQKHRERIRLSKCQ